MDKTVEKYKRRRDARVKARMDSFNENDHPRDENGRFTSGGGGKSAGKSGGPYTAGEIAEKGKAYYAKLKKDIEGMKPGIEKDVATHMTLPQIKGGKYLGGMSDNAFDVAMRKLKKYGKDAVMKEFDKQMDKYNKETGRKPGGSWGIGEVSEGGGKSVGKSGRGPSFKQREMTEYADEKYFEPLYKKGDGVDPVEVFRKAYEDRKVSKSYVKKMAKEYAEYRYTSKSGQDNFMRELDKKGIWL